MLRTCVVRLPASVLTLSVRSFQTPETPFTRAWPPSLPSVPTSRATRVTSSANDESWSTIAFDGRADAPELALHGLPLDRQLHLLGEIAVGDRVDDARDLGGGADEVVDQRVERGGRVGPVPAGGRRVRALGQPALAADGAADACDLLAERLAAVGELVERAVEVGGDALAGERAGGRGSHRRGRPGARRAAARARSAGPGVGAVLRRLRAVLRLRLGRLRGLRCLAPLRFMSDRHVVPPISLEWVTSHVPRWDFPIPRGISSRN